MRYGSVRFSSGEPSGGPQLWGGDRFWVRLHVHVGDPSLGGHFAIELFPDLHHHQVRLSPLRRRGTLGRELIHVIVLTAARRHPRRQEGLGDDHLVLAGGEAGAAPVHGLVVPRRPGGIAAGGTRGVRTVGGERDAGTLQRLAVVGHGAVDRDQLDAVGLVAGAAAGQDDRGQGDDGGQGGGTSDRHRSFPI